MTRLLPSLPVTYQNAQARFKDLYTAWYIGTCTHPMAAEGYPHDWLYRLILAAWPSPQEFQCGNMRKHVDVPRKG